MKGPSYDIVAVGTGFATSFFLHRYLRNHKRSIRVLVLEAGRQVTHAEQLEKRTGDELPNSPKNLEAQFVNRTPEKSWAFYTAFGGGSNCWVACTPRMMPEDFRLKSDYGIGADWPLSYDDLESFYCDAEELMQVSGDSNDSPYPRSRPYPQPPHRFTAPDRELKKAFPTQYFTHPCARSPNPVPGQRPACCNNGVCKLCPVNAKFTVLNGVSNVYKDHRVELIHNARVLRLNYSTGAVNGVVYMKNGEEVSVSCDLAVLGANALFNPYLLLRSGLEHPELGRGLCEQVSRSVYIELDGLNNFQGSTVSNGLGYMFYPGQHRRRKAAALIQSGNQPDLRNVRGKWLQRLKLNFVFEEFRLPENRVTIASEDPNKPAVTFKGRSKHTDQGLSETEGDLQKVLGALPTKSYEIGNPWRTDSHIMGTTVMGDDPIISVVDRNCVHHQLRNLLVLGSGVFPTAAPANPTLTLSALALRAAHQLCS